MREQPGHGTGADPIGLGRLLVQLLLLIALAGVLAALVGWGKGWRWDLTARVLRREARLPDVLPGPPRVRQPTVAGQFYPAAPDDLFREVRRLLASSPGMGIRQARAVLVPHAGYVFSGELAAAAFREVDRGFRRVFLLAANHNGDARFSGVSLPEATHYAIPGVEIPLSAVVTDLRKDPLFTHEPRAHTMHMLEVELPFVHELRGRPDYTIVPMILGHLDGDAVDHLAAVLDAHADPETLIVFSVDLSHFHPDAQARALDRYTIDAVMSRNREAVARAETDGNQVLATMLALAARRGWQPTLAMARNSGDVSGDTNRVVGYAAVVFHPPPALTRRERAELLGFARQSIEERLRHDVGPGPDGAWLDRHPRFRMPRAVFVTLEKHGRLRGCMGDVVSSKPLYVGVRDAALRAAFGDPRFPPVTEAELGDLVISISVLDYPARVSVGRPEDYLDVLRPLRDGVILVHEGRQSTFLPQVWEDIPDPVQFLSSLALKQGSPADAWRSPSTTLFRYDAYVFGEDALTPR